MTTSPADPRRGPIQRLMAALHAPIYEARLAELVRRITPHLRAGDRVLDVGCGVGTLGKAILGAPGCPEGVRVEGLERVKRGGEPIEVHEYDGRTIPHPDGAYDAVILADVLHHEPDPDRLLDECARVSRRLLVIKDHQLQGPLARTRISVMDWAANAPYGVPCLYRYNTPAQWTASHRRLGARADEELRSMKLYPPGWNLVFGGRLQYMAVLRVPGGGAAPGA